MKKVSHYNGDSFFFHQKVAAAKKNSPKDPTYKHRIQSMMNVSKSQFVEYDCRFASDTLEGMSQLQLTERDVADFKRLYRFSDKAFTDLYDKLSFDEHLHTYPFCPLCDISEAHTLDHILPQSAFPVLSDHPRNLIRCCHSCNDWKSDEWLENGQRRFLDLYIDDLPAIQMLFVRIDVVGDAVTYDYFVSDACNPDADIYRKYRNTFVKLHLRERYIHQTDEEISSMKSIIKSNLNIYHSTDEQLKDVIRQTATDEQQRHGTNYWRAVLKLAICDSDQVFAIVKNVN